MKNWVCGALFLGVAAAGLSQAASAASWSESGDAGELLGTAQVTIGTGALTSISGSIGTGADIDLYKISIVDTAAFAVTVTSNLSFDNDAQLFLFDAAGNLVIWDDDSGSLFPQFAAGELAGSSPGTYYLAYDLYNTDPSGDPLTGWTQSPAPPQTGPYTLSLAGAAFAEAGAVSVPEPGALALFGLGVAGLALARRRKARA